MNEIASGSRRWLPALVGGAGLVVLVITLAFGRLAAVQSAGACWSRDAVFLFEFATSEAELTRIFGAEDSACRPLNLAAMDASNTLDVLAYIPAYTAFTCLAALYFAGAARRLRAAAIALAVIAAAADYIETTTLLSMTNDLELATSTQMTTACAAAWVKFGCLALHAAVLGAACFKTAPRRPVLGALLALPIAGFLCMAVDFDLYNLLKIGFFASWTPLLIVGIRDALFPPNRRSLAPAS